MADEFDDADTPDGFKEPSISSSLASWLGECASLPLRPSSPTVLGPWREKIARSNAISHAKQLRSRLDQIQASREPPRRMADYQLYIAGLYEWRSTEESSKASTLSTPSSSPPDTPSTMDDTSSVVSRFTDMTANTTPPMMNSHFDDKFIHESTDFKQTTDAHLHEIINVEMDVFRFKAATQVAHGLATPGSVKSGTSSTSKRYRDCTAAMESTRLDEPSTKRRRMSATGHGLARLAPMVSMNFGLDTP